LQNARVGRPIDDTGLAEPGVGQQIEELTSRIT